MKTTSALFGAYLKCSYKTHLEAANVEGQVSDYEHMRERIQKAYSERGIRHVFNAYEFQETARPLIVTDRLLKEGLPVIVNARIVAEDIEADCDVLERVGGESPLGNFYYVPVLFRTAERISKDDRLLLGFAGLALAALQNRPVGYGKIISGKYHRSHRIKLDRDSGKVTTVMESIKRLFSSEQPPQMILNEHCRVCKFRDSCVPEAKKNDHLSLLRGMPEAEIARLNKRGIFTVTQYAYTFRPKRTQAKTNSRRRRFDLRALAIRDKRIYILAKPILPIVKNSIYLDVEGDPDRDFYYLIGMLVATDSMIQHHSFWADTVAEEIDIAVRFLEQLAAYDDFRIFHYGAYEKKFLIKMKSRLTGAPKAMIDRVMACAFNVLEPLYSGVYFPTYSNELKEIGRHLGCSWTDQNASGLQSLVWRHWWEIHRQEELKTRLIRYNHEDCLALKRLVEFLSEIQQTDEKEYQSDHAYACNFTGSYPHKKYGKIDFCIPEMEYINRCAYFDYQQSKVSVARSTAKGRKLRGRRRNSALPMPVGRTVTLVRPTECPKCGSQKVYANQKFYKRVTDLKFSGFGVKRWTVEYQSNQYRCPMCHGTFSNRQFKELHRCGHGLISWVLYFNVVINVPLNRMRGCLTELFGISLSRALLLNYKKRAASYYQASYMELVSAVRNSHVVYADETQVKIGPETHYVWVFTNTHEVVFAYCESRESSFVKEFLDGFKGVLVSDFYAAYDTIDCPQQKCLIHLIRDMNDDLIANPFDEEFKQLIQAFTILLRAIVETIDQYGLNRRHLQRHRTGVDKFYDGVFKEDSQSEAVRKYRKRFEKNQEKLFTFLNYDGVSWNNNNAEHAIKHFATYRRMQQGMSTAVTIQEHLVLLSLFQTCEYRNISFLKFLLSKQLGVDRYGRRSVGPGGRPQESL